MSELEIILHQITAAKNVAEKRQIESMQAEQVVKDVYKQLEEYYEGKHKELF